MFLPHAKAALVLSGVAALALGCSESLGADEPKDPVRLRLSSASAERFEKDVVFTCEAVLINNTGAAFSVRSSFFSAFDGLDLVVFTDDGKKLLQQSYLMHQSPFSKPRLFPVGQGENAKTMGFPISGLPQDARTVRVLLVGTLLGTDHGVLCSDVVRVMITAREK